MDYYQCFNVNLHMETFDCSYEVMLQVKGATGGLWKFPIHFIATEPEADDTITIEAAGLGKESAIGFRLNSQTRYNIIVLLSRIIP